MDIFGLLTRLTAILMVCGAVLTTFPVAGQERVIISEFMASNKKTRTDQDRQFSDWIEIYNAGATAANLEGWHLTDKRSAPTQWTFPAVTLAPNSYLVVFASQKNRRQPGAELHTNFKLAANGDYLALIKPDGVTVASEYAPAYQVQLPDVSYGLPMSEVRISLAPSNAPRRILVPSADIGTNWTRPDFDDSTWSAASGGVGYDRSTNYAGLIATDLRSEMFGKNTSVYIRTPFVASDEFSQRLKLRLHYNDGFVAYLNGEEILRRNAPAALQWNSAAAAAHGVSSPTFLEEKFESAGAGYTLNQTSPKLRPRISPPTGTIPEYYLRLSNGRISGQANSVAFDQTSPGLNQTITADFDFRTKNFGPAPDSLCFLLIPTSAYGTEGAGVSLDELKDNKAPNLKGVLAVRLQFFQGQNFASVHWNGAERLNIKMPIDPTALLPRVFHHARISIQHDEKGASISVSITPDVYGRSKKTYRIFERSSLSGVFPFENRIQFSSCLGNLAGAIDLANIKVQLVSGEVSAETFDISRFTHLLRAGTNMLAIHGLNRAADDADFLIAPELVAEGMILQTNSPRYFAPATPGTANAEGFPGVSAPPHFSISGGIYTNDVSLDLRTGSASAVIRYTLDGSEPNLSSRSYAGPLRITGSSPSKPKHLNLASCQA